MKLDMFCDTKRLIRGRTENIAKKFNETHQKNVVLNTFSLEFLFKICKFFTWILNKFFCQLSNLGKFILDQKFKNV